MCLLHGPVYRVPVILVPERHRSDDDAVPQTDDGHLVAKLVFLVFLALADAEDIRLMERVYLVPVRLFTPYKPYAKFKMLTVFAL